MERRILLLHRHETRSEMSLEARVSRQSLAPTLVAEIERFFAFVVMFGGWVGEAFYCFFELDVLLSSHRISSSA